jgi:hypothetical protein
MVDGNQVYVYETDGLGGVLVSSAGTCACCSPNSHMVTTYAGRL